MSRTKNYWRSVLESSYSPEVTEEDLQELRAVWEAEKALDQAIRLMGGREDGPQESAKGALQAMKELYERLNAPRAAAENSVFGKEEMILLLRGLDSIKYLKEVENLLYGGVTDQSGGVAGDISRLYSLVYRFCPKYVREDTFVAEEANRWVDRVLDDESTSVEQKAECLMG